MPPTDPTDYLVSLGVPRAVALRLLAEFDQLFNGEPREVAEAGFRKMLDRILDRKYGRKDGERLVQPGYESTGPVPADLDGDGGAD